MIGWRKRTAGSPAAVLLAVVCLLVAPLAGSVPCNPFLGSGSAAALEGPDSAEAVPGEILVKFRDPLTAAAQGRMHEALGFRELGRIEELGVVRVGVEPGVTLEEAVRLYEAQPNVEYAEPNYILRSAGTPNDALFVDRQQWYYDLIEAPAAWDVETGDASIVVAVLDTGIDVSHPDLKDNLWTNTAEIEGNGIDDDNNGCLDDSHGCNFVTGADPSCRYREETPNNEIEDDNGHGTFVAGIVAAGGNNQIGVTGTAPQVTIMPVKALDCTGSGTTAGATAGILYAARSGADILNISFGGENDSATLRNALQEAHDVFGTVIVASAGNEGRGQVTFPARYEEVISVSASNRRNPDTKAPFSNWGPEVNVTAPGVDIVSTVPRRFCDDPWPCVGNQPYAEGSGTSFSTALVSGAAALILSHTPTMTTAEVAEQLTSTALDQPDGPYTNWDGSGRIQMEKSLQEGVYRLGVSGVTRN